MMKQIFGVLGAIAFFFTPNSCLAPALTITAPGRYTVGWNVPYDAGSGESLISIESNNVILDLEEYTLDQTNSTTNVSGIKIGNGFSNITITNGRIRNVTGAGILITPSSAHSEKITIEDIVFENCGLAGLSIEGVGGFSTQNLIVRNCTFLDCARDPSATDIVRISGESPTIESLLITQRPTTTPLSGARNSLRIDTTHNGLFSGIRIAGIQTTGNLVGIHTNTLTAVKNSLFQNIVITDLISTTSNATGMITSGCQNTTFNRCMVNDLIGSSAIGISCENQQSPNLFLGCSIASLVGNSRSIGFFLDTVESALFLDCVSNQITTTGTNGISDGFVFDTTNRCHGIRCLATNGTGTGTGSQAIGFRFIAASNNSLTNCASINNSGVAGGIGYILCPLCTECRIMDCMAYNNGITSTNNSGFEVDASGSGTNIFLRNAALRNGTTAANQFRNFATTQRTTITRTGTNSTAQPWTNIAVT